MEDNIYTELVSNTKTVFANLGLSTDANQGFVMIFDYSGIVYYIHGQATFRFYPIKIFCQTSDFKAYILQHVCSVIHSQAHFL